MPRRPRFVLPGIPLHIIQRGNNRAAAFLGEQDYHDYREALSFAARRHGCEIHAYVLMTNHVHLLITPRDAQGPPKMMQTMGRWFVRRMNDRNGRTGTLWEGRYKSMVVDSESYILTCSRYVELNPIRARMVANPADYHWSSYCRNAWGAPDDLITDSRAYEALGRRPVERQAAYRSLFDTALDDGTLETIRHATQRGTGVVESSLKLAGHALGRADHPHGGDRRSERFRQDKAANFK